MKFIAISLLCLAACLSHAAAATMRDARAELAVDSHHSRARVFDGRHAMARVTSQAGSKLRTRAMSKAKVHAKVQGSCTGSLPGWASSPINGRTYVCNFYGGDCMGGKKCSDYCDSDSDWTGLTARKACCECGGGDLKTSGGDVCSAEAPKIGVAVNAAKDDFDKSKATSCDAALCTGAFSEKGFKYTQCSGEERPASGGAAAVPADKSKTMTRWASMSKTLAGIVAVKMVHDPKIKLDADAPITKYYPQFTQPTHYRRCKNSGKPTAEHAEFVGSDNDELREDKACYDSDAEEFDGPYTASFKFGKDKSDKLQYWMCKEWLPGHHEHGHVSDQCKDGWWFNEDYKGYDCNSFNKNPDNCRKYGTDKDINGITANDACCGCNAGKKHIVQEKIEPLCSCLSKHRCGDIEEVPIPAADNKPITLNLLMSHRAGFLDFPGRYFANKEWANPGWNGPEPPPAERNDPKLNPGANGDANGQDGTVWSVRQWAEKDQPVNLGAPPDSGYYYSGGGANLAAAVLSMAAKKPYAELVRKYVSEPLGLCSLQMDQAWNKPSHRAFGYVARSDPTYASRGPNSCSECTDATMHDLSWDGGGSAFMSTIDDLTAYGQALLSDTTWLTPAERTTLGWTSFVVADADKYRRAYSFDPNSYSFDQHRFMIKLSWKKNDKGIWNLAWLGHGGVYGQVRNMLNLYPSVDGSLGHGEAVLSNCGGYSANFIFKSGKIPKAIKITSPAWYSAENCGTDQKAPAWQKQQRDAGRGAGCPAKKICTCPHGQAAGPDDCPATGKEKCTACTSAGFFLHGGVCKPHKNCDADGKTIKTAGTLTVDAVCGDLKRCHCHHGQPAVGKECPKSGSSKCTACGAGFFLTAAGLCAKHQDCEADGKDTKKVGTPTSDAVCGDLKQCTCVDGTGAIGKACPKTGTSLCASCKANHWLAKGACTKWTDCDHLGKELAAAGTAAADSVCGPDKQCQCAKGTGAAGKLCPKTGMFKCVSCVADHFLTLASTCQRHKDCDASGKDLKLAGTPTSDETCGPLKACGCVGGIGAAGVDCPKTGMNKCISCKAGHWLDDSTCKPWTDCDDDGKDTNKAGTPSSDAVCGKDKQCSCAKGTGASGSNCPKTGDIKCVECDDDHFLASPIACSPHKNCDAKGKVTKTEGTGIADAICGAEKICKCDPMTGNAATGVDCPKNGMQFCDSCNAAHFLDGPLCEPLQLKPLQDKVVNLAKELATLRGSK